MPVEPWFPTFFYCDPYFEKHYHLRPKSVLCTSDSIFSHARSAEPRFFLWGEQKFFRWEGNGVWGGSRETVRGALSVIGKYSAGVWGRQPPAAAGQRGLGRSPSRGSGDRVPGGGLGGRSPPSDFSALGEGFYRKIP